MKEIKKIMALLLVAVMVMGCGAKETDKKKEETQKEEVRTDKAEERKACDIKVAALKGPTGLGLSELMHEANEGKLSDNYTFEVTGAPSDLVGGIVQGEYDIACVPTNLAAVLYNKTKGQVMMGAVNTKGVLYIMENGDEIQKFSDLKGKKIVTLGEGSVPEYVLNYLLKENGLNPGEDVTVEFASEPAEAAQKLLSGEATVAMLPQPFVTSVQMKNPSVRVAFDVTEEWEKATDGKDMAMGCIVVQKAFAKSHPEALEDFMKAYEKSAAFANKNPKEAGAYAEEAGILKAAIAEKAIPKCSIVFEDGATMKKDAENFLDILFKANPKSVGGKMPGEDFYFEGK